MDRHILGTFKNEEDAVSEVEKLLNEEDYSPDELMFVTDKSSQYDKKIESIKNVKVNKVEVEEDSIWDRVKEAFSFGSYDSEGSNTLEEYGVPHDRSEHYIEALKDGEIVLLADTDAPKQSELSEVNEEIIESGEREESMNKKNDAPIDEVNSEEPEAIKNKKPSSVKTSENREITDSVNPDQVNSTRKEGNPGQDALEDNNEKTQGKESKKEPDLTGQEDSVEKDESEHGYGNTVAEGVVSPEAKSPLNTDKKDIKEPHENTDAPEAEANYSKEMEEQGKKSWEDNK